jgi:DNA topoisomerase IB
MGKRQTRVFRQDIPDHLQDLLQCHVVQMILRTRAVIQGKLLMPAPELFELIDQSRNKHTIALHQIEEIIYDKEAAF